MRNVLQRISMTNIAYVCLLMALAALGIFIHALAVDSPAAGALGVGVIVLLVAAFGGFRLGARMRAKYGESVIEIPSENIFARPVRREDVERYLARYRRSGESQEPVLKSVAAPSDDGSRETEPQAA